jgi:hypothetical protein
MAAALTELPGTAPVRLLPRSSPARTNVAGLALGRNVEAVLRSALAETGGIDLRRVGNPDGLVIVARVEDVGHDAAAMVPAELDGRPIGVVAVGDCPVVSAEVLAGLRRAVIRAGGLPVGAGLWLDAIDAQCGQDGLLADLTVHALLAVLGRRVGRLAWSRRVLRYG